MSYWLTRHKPSGVDAMAFQAWAENRMEFERHVREQLQAEGHLTGNPILDQHKIDWRMKFEEAEALAHPAAQ